MRKITTTILNKKAVLSHGNQRCCHKFRLTQSVQADVCFVLLYQLTWPHLHAKAYKTVASKATKNVESCSEAIQGHTFWRQSKLNFSFVI